MQPKLVLKLNYLAYSNVMHLKLVYIWRQLYIVVSIAGKLQMKPMLVGLGSRTVSAAVSRDFLLEKRDVKLKCESVMCFLASKIPFAMLSRLPHSHKYDKPYEWKATLYNACTTGWLPSRFINAFSESDPHKQWQYFISHRLWMN